MEITIYSLFETEIDKFICQDTDYYAHISRSATDEDPTVDIIISTKCVAVSDNHIIIEFPNGAILHVTIQSCMYHKIEVM